MHKGYTLNYFINFFKSIPDHRWTEGELQRGNTVQKCALGHCLTDQRTGKLVSNSESDLNTKAEALQDFLGNEVEAINDGDNTYFELGSTPRGRILRALRNRKRTGSVL